MQKYVKTKVLFFFFALSSVTLLFGMKHNDQENVYRLENLVIMKSFQNVAVRLFNYETGELLANIENVSEIHTFGKLFVVGSQLDEESRCCTFHFFDVEHGILLKEFVRSILIKKHGRYLSVGYDYNKKKKEYSLRVFDCKSGEEKIKEVAGCAMHDIYGDHVFVYAVKEEEHSANIHCFNLLNGNLEGNLTWRPSGVCNKGAFAITNNITNKTQVIELVSNITPKDDSLIIIQKRDGNVCVQVKKLFFFEEKSQDFRDCLYSSATCEKSPFADCLIKTVGDCREKSCCSKFLPIRTCSHNEKIRMFTLNKKFYYVDSEGRLITVRTVNGYSDKDVIRCFAFDGKIYHMNESHEILSLEPINKYVSMFRYGGKKYYVDKEMGKAFPLHKILPNFFSFKSHEKTYYINDHGDFYKPKYQKDNVYTIAVPCAEDDELVLHINEHGDILTEHVDLDEIPDDV